MIVNPRRGKQMAHQLLLAISGMLLLAAGTWRIESRVLRTYKSAAFAALLGLGGIVVVTISAFEAGPSWSIRLAIFGTYSAAGALLGRATVGVRAKRVAGVVLAHLGTGVSLGFKIVSAVAFSIGMLAVVMQIVEAGKGAHRPGSSLVLGL
jgi:hypothetical protein